MFPNKDWFDGCVSKNDTGCEQAVDYCQNDLDYWLVSILGFDGVQGS